MSPDKAHGPIYTPGPFVPTIAPQNFLLLLSEKERDFDTPILILLFPYIIPVCVGVFSTTQKHALDALAFRTQLQLIPTTPCSPCSTVRWGSNGWGFYGNASRSFPARSSLIYIYIYIYTAKKLYPSHFSHSKFKSWSEEHFFNLVSSSQSN